MADLVFRIVNILKNASGPMSAATIAREINRQDRTSVKESDVNDTCLRSVISAILVKDAQGRWALGTKDSAVAQPPTPTLNPIVVPPSSPRALERWQSTQTQTTDELQKKRDERYRQLLLNDPPLFLDRVNTPWDQVPDVKEYNQHAYNRIVRALGQLSRSQSQQEEPNSQGMLILGEAGTGKTHLLMRVARNLSGTNHILFVRKPNNEEAVFQHIWANIVSSLARYLPDSGTQRNQLDDLLAHVFSKVLIPELEQDIREDKDAEQKQRWVSRLTADPFNLFSMLGEGEQRQANMERIRRRTLRYLQDKHPNVDQKIAHVLITYCFVVTEDRKRLLLSWLSGQDIDEIEAKAVGLPTSWVNLDHTSTDVAIQQQREEQALRAITTIGVLSTYYQPLILAFDQLEGLRDHRRLTERWGDAVREIFTTTPNFLVVTCIFPSLWKSWFGPELDPSASQRICQQYVELERFGPHHGLSMLAAHLEPSFIKHRLPTNIYPFSSDDVARLCAVATSPRSFIQAARGCFETWLDADVGNAGLIDSGESPKIVSTDDVDTLLAATLRTYEEEHLRGYDSQIPLEQDFFGRVRNILETVFEALGERVSYSRGTCGTKVMPTNVVVKSAYGKDAVCIAVANGGATAFAARMRNLNTIMRTGEGEWQHTILLRDSRCRASGPKGREYIQTFASLGGTFITVGSDESARINALYDTLVSIEEHDLSIGKHEVDKRQFVEHLRSRAVLRRTETFRTAGRAAFFSRAVGDAPLTTAGLPSTPQSGGGALHSLDVTRVVQPGERALAIKPEAMDGGFNVDVLIGSDDRDCAHLGIVGELKDDRRRLGITFSKPLCVVVLGYMGSGKSYALGVLIENALLSIPQLTRHAKPLSVVAFNYRRNPEARFEYWGFGRPTSTLPEVERLRRHYGAEPMETKEMRVFGYGPELAFRREEYRGVSTVPIAFKPDELGAEHWEILMKPPNAQTEYMDVVRDIIQKLYYQERLTFKNLERHIQLDERLTETQRRRAMNRMSFAEKWISDSRPYSWSDVLNSGAFNVFDLRMQTMTSQDALRLCLIITDLVRRTRNGINKLIVFDEAHEYVDCKELVDELENAITQIRHDGLSFVLASQFPDKIPERIFKYLLTRMIFKIPSLKAINHIRRAAPNLECLSPQQVSNLDLEQGACLIQTDDDCSDTFVKVPQLLCVRPRCTQHGGQTVRVTPEVEETIEHSDDTQGPESPNLGNSTEEQEVELCPGCGRALVLCRGPAGPFIGCSGYPKCHYSRSLPQG